MLERVQKILARAGIDSRRNSEELIAHGRVTVNSKVIKLGDKADSTKDTICVDGRPVKPRKLLYLIFNKPKGCVCAVEDERYRTVLDYVQEEVYPVGRLDKDTEGLLLLTNDGDFMNRVIHPRYQVDRVYVAFLDKKFRDIDKLKQGVHLEESLVVPKYARVFNNQYVELSIHSGIKHVVKRLFKALGYRVLGLKRIRLGHLTLGGLKPGRFRQLSEKEVEALVS